MGRRSIADHQIHTHTHTRSRHTFIMVFRKVEETGEPERNPQGEDVDLHTDSNLSLEVRLLFCFVLSVISYLAVFVSV